MLSRSSSSSINNNSPGSTSFYIIPWQYFKKWRVIRDIQIIFWLIFVLISPLSLVSSLEMQIEICKCRFSQVFLSRLHLKSFVLRNFLKCTLLNQIQRWQPSNSLPQRPLEYPNHAWLGLNGEWTVTLTIWFQNSHPWLRSWTVFVSIVKYPSRLNVGVDFFSVSLLDSHWTIYRLDFYCFQSELSKTTIVLLDEPCFNISLPPTFQKAQFSGSILGELQVLSPLYTVTVTGCEINGANGMNTTLITVSDSCLILKYCEIYGNMVPDDVALMRAVNSNVTIEDTILYENYFGPQGLIQFRSSDVHIEDVQIVSRLRPDVNLEAVIGHQPEPHDTSVIQTDQSNITLEEVVYYRSLDDDGKIFLDVNLEVNNFLKVDTSSFAETLIKIHGSELEVKEAEEIFIDDSILHPTGKHSDDDPDIYLGQSLTIVSHANKKNFSFLPRSQDIFKTKHIQGNYIKSSAIEVMWSEEMTIQMMDKVNTIKRYTEGVKKEGMVPTWVRTLVVMILVWSCSSFVLFACTALIALKRKHRYVHSFTGHKWIKIPYHFSGMLMERTEWQNSDYGVGFGNHESCCRNIYLVILKNLKEIHLGIWMYGKLSPTCQGCWIWNITKCPPPQQNVGIKDFTSFRLIKEHTPPNIDLIHRDFTSFAFRIKHKESNPQEYEMGLRI